MFINGHPSQKDPDLNKKFRNAEKQFDLILFKNAENVQGLCFLIFPCKECTKSSQSSLFIHLGLQVNVTRESFQLRGMASLCLSDSLQPELSDHLGSAHLLTVSASPDEQVVPLNRILSFPYHLARSCSYMRRELFYSDTICQLVIYVYLIIITIWPQQIATQRFSFQFNL